MGNRVIGPGQPCGRCGEVYGQHKATCSVPRERREQQEGEDMRRGRALIEAIQNDDAELVGKILRGVA